MDHEASLTIAAAMATIESRLDIVHQESRKTAEGVSRLKLALDNSRGATLRNSEKLDDIFARLARIEEKLGE